MFTRVDAVAAFREVVDPREPVLGRDVRVLPVAVRPVLVRWGVLARTTLKLYEFLEDDRWGERKKEKQREWAGWEPGPRQRRRVRKAERL